MPVLIPSGPKAPSIPKKGFGKYSIKATSRVIAQNGKDYINIRGYDVDMSIVERVDKITRTKANNNNMVHTETEITFLFKPTPYKEGTIFLDYVDCNKTILVP
tara:strand:- start:1425 stop:1733 length:309 start_codon:yes stop_codon:yes gene_type:complete